MNDSIGAARGAVSTGASATRRRILSADCGIPSWGDSGAWAYNLHARLRESGFGSLLLHLLCEADVHFFRHVLGTGSDNPGAVDGVRNCVTETASAQQAALAEEIEAFAPDLLIAWGIAAAHVLKRAAPQLPLLLMADQCASLEALVELGAIADYVGFRSGVERGVLYPRSSAAELEAVAACDLAVLPSALAADAYRHFYPDDAGKMTALPVAPAILVLREAESYAALCRPFAQRDIDVLFVAGRWSLPARNLPLAAALCARLRPHPVHVVGECARPLPATTHGIVTRRTLFELLGRARVAVFPGLADAAPSGMFEASAMGCNVVTSPNTGYWELCHEELLSPTPLADEFLPRIEMACSRPFPDRRERLMGEPDTLLDILAVF